MSTKNAFDREEAERIFCRMRAYCNSVEDAIHENDWNEALHLAGHVEQEAVEFRIYLKETNNGRN